MRVLGLVALMIAAGCTSPGDESGPAQVSEVQYPKVDVPRDRDERAVVAALRHLDPCSLLDPAGMSASAGSKPEATAPYRCRVEKAEQDDSVTLFLGVPFDRQHRYNAAPLELAGAKAYLDVSEPDDDTCRVAIPVSFELTVSIVGRKGPRSSPGDICAPTKSVATAAASRLANSPAGAATGWTACELLAAATGDTVLEKDEILGLDSCRASERGPDQQPGRLLFRVGLDYGGDPTNGQPDVRTVAGKRIAVLADGTGCSFLWSAGPSANPRLPERVVSFRAYDCARGEQLVPRLVSLLESDNPDRTGPQRPLLIPQGEPDMPAAGACADYFPNGTSCQPSTDVPVPQAAQLALTAAAGDARVACALAKEAVTARFGSTLTPVLGSRSTERPDCYFVEPGHTTIVEVFVRANDDLTRAVSIGDARDLTVAGRPAKAADVGNDRRLCVLPVSGATTGLLCVVAHFLPGRGVETGSQADTGKAAQLEPVVTDIVSRFFS